MDNSLKGLILAAGVAITCLVISLGFHASGEAKNITSTSTARLSEFSTELKESNLTSYDELVLTGSDVVNFIKKHLDGYSSIEDSPLCIYIKTSKAENTYSNSSNIVNIKNFTHDQYISPLAKFIGEVIRDENDVIYLMKFIQK